ncbi:hypothetical protein JBE27_31835 [Streptomyces albiflaviniger]|nr:hypothetical protein [Streptomyces albiflaviniger]
MTAILAIDQGTSGTKAIVVDDEDADPGAVRSQQKTAGGVRIHDGSSIPRGARCRDPPFL